LSEVFFGLLGIPKNMIGLGDEGKAEKAPKGQQVEPTKEEPPAQ